MAATGSLIEPPDPGHRETVFHYGGIDAGLPTPGVEVPKLGSAIGTQIAGRMLNGLGVVTSLWDVGTIFRNAAVAGREQMREDFTGACILADLGISTPIRGLVGSLFLVGIDPFSLLTSLSPPPMVAERVMGRGGLLAPRAVILVADDSRGLFGGGNAYVGYMR